MQGMLSEPYCPSRPPLPEKALARLLGILRSGDPRVSLGRVGPEDLLLDAWQHGSRDCRRRFELSSTEEESIILIIWLPGQFSPAHDHGGSRCIFRILQGVATEQRFDLRGEGRVALVEEDRFLSGSIVSCDGEDIHAMGNDQENVEPLVTLHIYRPRPVMREYQIVSGDLS